MRFERLGNAPNGKKGAKLNSFDVFEKSINDCESIFRRLDNARLENSSDFEFDFIKDLFETLNPMASGFKIVGVSKVLAHYITTSGESRF